MRRFEEEGNGAILPAGTRKSSRIVREDRGPNPLQTAKSSEGRIHTRQRSASRPGICKGST